MARRRKATPEVIAHMREERIFRFCIESAHQIIAELEQSGGDHGDDVQKLLGLIETWSELRFAEQDMADKA